MLIPQFIPKNVFPQELNQNKQTETIITQEEPDFTQGKKTAKVDGTNISYSNEDINYLIACIITELGDWQILDQDNIRKKAVAMTYVVLRRAKEGNYLGGHNIKNNILAPNQFYGITLYSTNRSPYKGKACGHSALALLNPEYRNKIENYAFNNPSEYMQRVVALFDPTQILIVGSMTKAMQQEAEIFRQVFETVKSAVNDVLNGKEKDTSKGAIFFGYVGDIYSSKYHQPNKLVAAIGNLGQYGTVENLLKDNRIKRASFRIHLYKNGGVDAIFFYIS